MARREEDEPIAAASEATKGMSVIDWWATMNHCGQVVSTSAPSIPARRPNQRAVPL